MANEKRLSLSFAVVKDGLTQQIAKSASGDMAGDNSVSTVQTIGTAWEALTLTDLASCELICLVNKDAANFVELAVTNDGTNKFAKLVGGGGPGSMAFFPPAAAATLYAKADTAACNLQIVAVEP